MKTKTLAIVEIAIVLCSLFLVAFPAIAAEQPVQKASASGVTTASEDDYVLGVYGNANEDETIDMGDVVYTKLAIFGKKPKTELCDAKYDGRINVLDVIQTKLIILGKERELTIVDTLDRIVTVKKPLQRILPTHPQAIETLRSLKVPKDIIVAIGTWPCPLDPMFFAEFSDVPCIGTGWNPDVEAILELNPDLVILTALFGRLKPTADVLESAGIPTVAFSLQTTGVQYPVEVEKLGYIFGLDKAKEFLDWHEEILNSVKDKVEKIPEEDKPKVYFASSFKDGVYYTHGLLNFIKLAGGKDIFADLPKKSVSVDPEAIMDRDPDIIVCVASWKVASGYDVDADETAEFKSLREEIMSQPELQNVAAVKNGRVYIIANHLVAFGPASGCRHFLQVAYQAKWFHPELFEDLYPQAIHQEYLTRFQGLDYDLDKKGVFAYPEPG